MKDDFSHLPYRSCVGVILLNATGHVWIGQRIAKWSDDMSENLWQMPQGGIDEGEEPVQAAFRELEEETGTAKAEVVAESQGWLTYDLPDGMLGTALKGKYRGQTQKWFVMRFTGSDADIDISAPAGHKAEFSDWRWAPMTEVVAGVVAFKQPVYQDLAREFASLFG